MKNNPAKVQVKVSLKLAPVTNRHCTEIITYTDSSFELCSTDSERSFTFEEPKIILQDAYFRGPGLKVKDAVVRRANGQRLRCDIIGHPCDLPTCYCGWQFFNAVKLP